MSKDSDRYPIENFRYYQSVGRLFEHRMGQIFSELGFKTEIAKGQSNGVDLKVYDAEDNLILVAELLNWSKYSELSNKRENSITSNLLQHNCNRLVIYTVLKNEDILSDHDISIRILKIGYQVQPKSFYDFFAEKKQVESRKIDSKDVKVDIRSKIVELLRSSGIESL